MESEAFQLPTPVRTGYIFLGWTGEGITEPQKTIEIPQGSTGDRTYTANWQVIEYTIITLLEGGNAGSSQVYFYTVEQTVTLPTPDPHGLHVHWLDRRGHHDAAAERDHPEGFDGRQEVYRELETDRIQHHHGFERRQRVKKRWFTP